MFTTISTMDRSIGKDIDITIIFPPNSNLEAMFPSPQSLQSCIANSIKYAIPINFIINDMYMVGILALLAKSCMLSTIKFSLNITDNSIITPVIIAMKFAISGLSFLITKQSVVEMIAIPINCIISKLFPPFSKVETLFLQY